MQYTLHLTEQCNLSCTYCPQAKVRSKKNAESNNHMTSDSIVKTINYIAQNQNGPVQITFYGGEPLLCKDLIKLAVERSKKYSGCNFRFSIVTNGTLLDEEFILYAQKEGIFISISLDGTRKSHDTCRVQSNGTGSFALVSNNIKSLLSVKPYSPVMMVVDPANVSFYAESVAHHFEIGFKYVVSALNYLTDWSAQSMNVLKNEYKKIADLYFEKTMREDKFYFSPFDSKISTYINGDEEFRERCNLGKKHLSITPDGSIYPCNQFVDYPEYSIGDIENGINEKKRHAVSKLGNAENKACDNCALNKRCNYYCSCIRLSTTGSLDKVSPVFCMHEVLLTKVADKLASRLYKTRSPMFIQKHYNNNYHLVSAIEDIRRGD